MTPTGSSRLPRHGARSRSVIRDRDGSSRIRRPPCRRWSERCPRCSSEPHPRWWRAASTIIATVDSFLGARLGAGVATDPWTTSRAQLGAPEWDSELLRLFGVPREILPAIGDTAGELGRLTHPDWKVELPLRARCVDQQ